LVAELGRVALPGGEFVHHRIPEPGVRQMVRRAGESAAGPEVLALCTSAAVLDNLLWRVRSRPQRIPAMIRAFGRLADDLRSG
jgi:hypothetical protein